MKNILALICLSASVAFAQTNPPVGVYVASNTPPAAATNVTQLLGLPASWGNVLAQFEGSFVDAQPYISNAVVTIETGGLYNASDKTGKFGGFLDVTVPTSQQSGVGLGGAYLDGHFLDANVTMKLGTTSKLPIVGTVYAYISDGPDYDFHQKGIGNYAFAGFVKKFDIGPNTTLTVGGGVGNISTLPGEEIAFGVSLTKHF